MNKILVSLLLFGFSFIVKSQTIVVRNIENNEPLELVTIVSDNPKAFASTNKEGKAEIKDFEGSKKIKFSLLGFASKILSYDEIDKLNFVVNLEIENLRLNEVVISATRWKQDIDQVSEKIITITAKEVAIQNPQTTADLLNLSGKVFIQKSQQGGGSPMIRGFATNRLLYVVDGIRMNNAIFRSGNLQNIISIDPFSINNTEVLFGSNSVIYGSDAIGGILSFETLQPQLSLTDDVVVNGKADYRYSSANYENTGHLDINVGWKNISFVTSFSSFNFGDLKMGSHGPKDYLRPFFVKRKNGADIVVINDDPLIQKPSGYSQINLMEKILFAPNRNLEIIYGFHLSETSSYSRYDRHIRYKNGLPRYGEWNYGPQKWMMNSLTVNYLNGNNIFDEMVLRTAWQKFEESRISRNINSVNRETRIENVDAYSLNFDFMKQINFNNKLFYGAELVYNNVKSIGIDKDISTNAKNVGPSRYPKSKWGSYAFYLSDQFNTSDKLKMNFGVRLNYFMLSSEFDTTFYKFPFTKAEIFNHSITGSIGLIYKAEPDLIISSNLSTAFRSPNVDDIGKIFDSAPGIIVVPNPKLEAETAYNFDFSVAKYFGNTLKIDITFFYTILKDALIRRDFQLNGLDSIMYDGELSRIQAIQNAAKANVYGVQAGLELKFPYGFGFTTDLNYQRGTEELDKGSISPSRHAPPIFGLSKISYTHNKISIQLYAHYSGGKKYSEMPEEEKAKTEIYAIDKNGNPYSPAWYTVNLKANYTLSEKFSIGAGIENITDQRYKTYSSGIAAAGRNFVCSVKIQF